MPKFNSMHETRHSINSEGTKCKQQFWCKDTTVASLPFLVKDYQLSEFASASIFP